MVTIMMMSGRMADLGSLKIKVFWDKDYDVIISIHDVTNKILSRVVTVFITSVYYGLFAVIVI